MAKNKKNNRFVYIIIVILSLIAIGYFGSQQFTILDETLQVKYTFEDNKVDITHNDIRLVPILYEYSGTQMTWGWFNANREAGYQVYGSISSSYRINGMSPSNSIYRLRSSDPRYCIELGHKGALSGTNGNNKVKTFDDDKEDGVMYWRKKDYELYPRTSINCYNDNEFTKYYKFQTVEPVITDGFYNTFELQYDVTLNNQKVSPFIIIDNITYRLDSNNKIIFEDTKIVNTKVYYGFEMVGDGTNTPIIGKDIKLLPSFTEKEEETQGSVIDDPVVDEPVVDTEEPIIEDISTPVIDTTTNTGGGGVTLPTEDEEQYSYIYIIVGVLIIGGIATFL